MGSETGKAFGRARAAGTITGWEETRLGTMPSTAHDYEDRVVELHGWGSAFMIAGTKGLKVWWNAKEGPEHDATRKGNLRFSAEGNHLAHVANKGEKILVVVDGQEGPLWDEVINPSPIFSPDGNHFAYAARNGRRWVVVVDGKEGPSHQNIGVGTLTFSPDGKRVAYVARRGNNSVVVVDGQDGPSETVSSDLGLFSAPTESA
ncbi:MAG: hypothetical protein NZ899_15195 [Thermoguttaceae bacterium]|nr:hypothetical protein [Thermoguttaceae bacterium]MDW8080251.1 hypothetical protein [Thermoguttaceae bacterium]